MSKEELEMFLLDLYNTKEPTLTEKGKQKIIKTIENLQERIDKAIEYIHKQTTDEDTGKNLGYSDNIDDEYLIDILKGE